MESVFRKTDLLQADGFVRDAIQIMVLLAHKVSRFNCFYCRSTNSVSSLGGMPLSTCQVESQTFSDSLVMSLLAFFNCFLKASFSFFNFPATYPYQSR